MPRVPLTEVLNLRISVEELEMLDHLAEAEGLPRSSMIRQLIRWEHKKRYDAPFPVRGVTPKRPKKK